MVGGYSYYKDSTYTQTGMISSASDQADYAVFVMKHDISSEYIMSRIDDYYDQEKSKKNLKRIVILSKDGDIIIDLNR